MKIEEYYAWLKDYFKLNYYKDGRVIRTIYNKENMHDRLQVAYAYYEAVNRNMDWYTKQNIITSIVNIKLTQLREVAKRFYEDSLDENVKLSAYEVVNTYSKQHLTRILAEYGEEEYASSIANNIVNNRPIETTKQLASIIEKSMPTKVVFKRNGAHKKTFQAIRIEVNGELDRLFETINYLISKLNKGGRIAILSFHSLEDRIVKNAYKINATGCLCPPKTPICICGHKQTLKLVNKKPVMASLQEQKENPRSTSAKLRIGEKI